jgi:hypothetical protein
VVCNVDWKLVEAVDNSSCKAEVVCCSETSVLVLSVCCSVLTSAETEEISVIVLNSFEV